MHELRFLRRRLNAQAVVAIVLCVPFIVFAYKGNGLGAGGVGLALIYWSIRIGHTTREIAKLKDRMESTGDDAGEQ